MVSQKIQATASKKGFTLVELIVVITILAILGTIGFISIQGYSAQSRDSKRTSDLRSLASALTIKATDGIALTSFVTAATGATMSGAVATNFNVAGLPMNFAQTDYVAGTPNFTALGVSASNFTDGTNNYRIGTSTRDGGVFQVAATMENSGVKSALTSGNYSPRSAGTFTANVLLGTGSGFTVSGLTGSGVGYFNRGDYIRVATVNAIISSTNGDGAGFAANAVAALPPSGTQTASVGTTAAMAEAPSLIAATTTSTGVTLATGTVAVGTTNLPY